jgi:hypothetical protein
LDWPQEAKKAQKSLKSSKFCILDETKHNPKKLTFSFDHFKVVYILHFAFYGEVNIRRNLDIWVTILLAASILLSKNNIKKINISSGGRGMHTINCKTIIAFHSGRYLQTHKRNFRSIENWIEDLSSTSEAKHHNKGATTNR